MFEEKYNNILTYEDFTPYINHIFKMKLPEESAEAELELIEAERTGPSRFKNFRDNFWLQFRDASGIEREQDNYELEHPKRGHIKIFLIPYAKDTKGMYYQAIFS